MGGWRVWTVSRQTDGREQAGGSGRRQAAAAGGGASPCDRAPFLPQRQAVKLVVYADTGGFRRQHRHLEGAPWGVLCSCINKRGPLMALVQV